MVTWSRSRIHYEIMTKDGERSPLVAAVQDWYRTLGKDEQDLVISWLIFLMTEMEHRWVNSRFGVWQAVEYFGMQVACGMKWRKWWIKTVDPTMVKKTEAKSC